MRWLLLSIFLIFSKTIGGDGSVSQADSNVKAFESEYPVGDARWCIDQARRTKFDLKRFEVLPGMGWDNLRNIEAGMVVTYNYTECKVTDDGRYLIPDSVFTIPIKASKVNSFAEVIDSWLNSSSTTSHTVNVQGGGSFKNVAASGSFSFEHSNLKSKQVEDKSVTVRVQLRYSRYEAKLQPDPKLTPAFKRRLLEMGADIELNNTDKALYSGQLLVRDFGTHYLTSITAGAALGKDDYIKRSFMASNDESKTDILAEASVSFFSAFDLKASYGYHKKDTSSKSYNDHLTRSYIWSHGGPLIGANDTANEWVKGLDLNLVAVDRDGEPLYNLITERMLPELPPQTVAKLTTIVRESIQLYYAWNTIRGCTKLGSPNFSFSANFDDGSCDKKSTNMTFGGVFQTCSISGDYQGTSPCQGKDQVNPLTGKASCPPSYKAVKMATEHRRIYQQTCRKKHWFSWSKTCHRWVSTGTYTSFWCAASGPVHQHSGYLFGGLYTTRHENPVTRGFTCPPTYYAFPLLTDLKICISDDFEQSSGQSLPFGGFFSCESGNPLSHGLIKPVALKAVHRDNGGVPLASFFHNMDTTEKYKMQMTKKCPEGYSQHIAALTQEGCAVHYCVRSGFLSGPLTPPVKRPPFTDPPTVRPSDNLFTYDLKAQTWQMNKKDEQVKSQYYSGDNHNDGLSAGTAAGISVVATLSCVAIATICVVAVQRRWKRKVTQYRPIVGESLENPVSYGSSSEADTLIPQSVVSEQA